MFAKNKLLPDEIDSVNNSTFSLFSRGIPKNQSGHKVGNADLQKSHDDRSKPIDVKNGTQVSNQSNDKQDPESHVHELNSPPLDTRPEWLKERENHPDVDGGWGWVIVIGSFIIHIIADGITYSFGIIMMELAKEFGTGKGDTSWVASIMLGMTFSSGPAASIMTSVFGCRVTTVVGAIITSVGFALSIFAQSIYYLYFTIGIMGGIGLGFIYLPGVVIVSQYFEKKRSLAMGIAVCGSGLGTFVCAPLVRELIDEYTWRGACLILSGLLLNCVCCGLLFRALPANFEVAEETEESDRETEFTMSPGQNGTLDESKIKEALLKKLHSHLDKQSCSDKKDSKIVNSCPNLTRVEDNEPSPPISFASGIVYKENKSALAQRQEEMHREMEILTAYKSAHVISLVSLVPIPEIEERDRYDSEGTLLIEKRSKIRTLQSNMRDAVSQLTDFALLKSFIFMMFCVSNFFTATGLNVPYIYLADLAKKSGVDGDSASILISVIGVGNTVGRIFFGFLSDIPAVAQCCSGNGRLLIYTISNLMNGIFTMLAPVMLSYPLLVTYASAFGVLIGTYVTLTAVVLVDLIGLDKLTSSFGLLLVFQGAATFIGPPIAGWICDATGSYDISFYVIGAMIAFSGITLLLFFLPCVYKTYFLPNLPKRDYLEGGDDVIDPEFMKTVQVASRRTSVVMLDCAPGSRTEYRRASLLASAATSRRTSYATDRRGSRVDNRRPSHISHATTSRDTSRRTSINTNQDWRGSRRYSQTLSRRPSQLPVPFEV